MTQIDYLSLYDNAKSELARLQNERTELEKQITALTKTISAIAPLVGAGAPEAAPVGLTDAIRSILARAEGPLSASEIRDRLVEMGLDMAAYSNPLATIHTVLRRLTDSDEADVQKESKIEPIAGKRFVIGKDLKGFVGIARIKRRYSGK
jgi:hypothetical protein